MKIPVLPIWHSFKLSATICFVGIIRVLFFDEDFFVISSVPFFIIVFGIPGKLLFSILKVV
jgi:hypothetical protein